MKKNNQNRKSMIAKIKIGQSQLGMDDWGYRQLLARVTGRQSCTECTIHQLEAILEELKRLGFQPRTPKKYMPPNHSQAKELLISKVWALLADNKWPWEYAHGLASKMFKVDRVEWLSEHHLYKLIAALQIHADRLKKRGSR